MSVLCQGFVIFSGGPSTTMCSRNTGDGPMSTSIWSESLRRDKRRTIVAHHRGQTCPFHGNCSMFLLHRLAFLFASRRFPRSGCRPSLAAMEGLALMEGSAALEEAFSA